MTPSIFYLASSASYHPDHPCSICLIPLSPLLNKRLGFIISHNNRNGIKHPLHEKCLKDYFATTPERKCPVCQDPIIWPIAKHSAAFKRCPPFTT